MGPWQKRMVGMVLLVSGTAGLAWGADVVTNVLEVHRIQVQPGGTEASESAAAARPGDLLEYKALFHNNGVLVAHGLSATLPLPVGTEFVPGSQQPAAATASIDGANFAALPLKRTVKAADGSSHEELVPAREYRYLRWAGTDLPASGDLSVSARVRIAGGAAAP